MHVYAPRVGRRRAAHVLEAIGDDAAWTVDRRGGASGERDSQCRRAQPDQAA